jgi:Ferritin-like domain
VKTAVKAARIIEQVGIGAFAGSGHLIQDPSVLTSANSIITSEARHQAIANLLNAASPSPQSFDIPLLPEEVLGIAGGLISDCDLGVKGALSHAQLLVEMEPSTNFYFFASSANPPLTVTNEGPIFINTQLQFSSPTLKGNTSVSHDRWTTIQYYCSTSLSPYPQNSFCQLLTGDLANATIHPSDECLIPPTFEGPTFVFITSNNQPLSSDVIVRQTQNSAVVAGPTVIFVDSLSDPIAQLIVNNRQ